MAKEIIVYGGLKAIVDDEDFERLAPYKWHMVGNYVCRTDRTVSPKRTIYMHKEIMNCPKGFVVDHINGNTLDNRKENLRIATTEQNRFNQKLRYNSSTGYKGVTFNKRFNKYQARIFKDNKTYSLGYFDNPHDAARMYNFWARDLFGEFARLNIIKEEDSE
jgi:hypothetical protein